MTDSKNETKDKEDGPTLRRRWCDTSVMPIRMFLHDGDSYWLVEEGQEDLFSYNHRNTTEGDIDVRRALAPSLFAYSSSEAIHPVESMSPRVLDEAMNASGQIVLGRKCTCAVQGTYYCPVEAELCRVWENGAFIGSRGHSIIQCEDDTAAPQEWTVRLVLPIVLFVYLFLMCYLIGSTKGKNAITYTRRLIFCWGEEKYDRALFREIEDRARQRFYRQLALERSRQSSEPSRKVPASLKTRSYDKATMKNQECMICLADFEEGDRVGDLPCGHAFHVEPCLKQWLGRKNHCPLCHYENVAIPNERMPKIELEDTVLQTSSDE